MESVNPSVQKPSSVRPQELLVDFLRQQTQLSIRLSQNLQGLSQQLLEKTRAVMARKVPLSLSFNNSIYQMVLQLACGSIAALASTEGAAAKCQSISRFSLLQKPAKLASDAVKAAYGKDVAEKANLDHKASLLSISLPKIMEVVSQAGNVMLSGRGEALSFAQRELDIFFEQNKTCQKSTTDAQDMLAATTRQIIN